MLSIKSVVATILLPGTACFIFPLVILVVARTSLFPLWGFPQVIALLVAFLGIAMVVWVSAAFVRRGKGTLMVIDPPIHLVITGLYRYSRNPMYVGVLLIILAEAVFFLSPWLVLYVAGVWIIFQIALAYFEEPQLKKRFGEEYKHYLQSVPRWIPRIRSR